MGAARAALSAPPRLIKSSRTVCRASALSLPILLTASSTSWPSRWRTIAKHQLEIEPFCRICLSRAVVTPATIADHVVDRGGVWNAFWTGELQSLCPSCNNSKRSKTPRDYRIDIGLDGFPIDPNHPVNRQRSGG
jgi:5-methylcytosine-specific restriction endonuclease McrA